MSEERLDVFGYPIRYDGQGRRLTRDGNVAHGCEMCDGMDECTCRLLTPTPPSDAVERVARAIDENLSQRHYGIPSDWDNLPEYQRGERLAAARAAIEAMRAQPVKAVTPAMIEAGEIELEKTQDSKAHDADVVQAIYLAMEAKRAQALTK